MNAILDINADVCSIRIVTKNRNTALIILHTTTAISYGLLDIQKRLIIIETDPNIIIIKHKKGQTALHIINGQDASVVDKLLESDRSTLDEHDKKGNTSLHMVTQKSRAQVILGQWFNSH